MATVTIPDLWPANLNPDVLEPVAILKVQAHLLEKKTGGILKAEVWSNQNDSHVQHHLDLLAPALHSYREQLLVAMHEQARVYPVTVQAECFGPPGPSAGPLSEAIARAASKRQAASQDEFLDILRQVLQSAQVRSLIESLIARSNQPNVLRSGATRPGSSDNPSEPEKEKPST